MNPSTTPADPHAERMSRAVQVYRLRDALISMTIRYGSSQQNAAYAERRARGGEPGAVDRHRRHQRAARRQFAAVQRLANALVHLAVTR